MSGWRQEHWSYTKWSKYDKCPLQADYQYNQRYPRQPPGKAAQRGINLHGCGENYLNKDVDVLPEEIVRWHVRMKNLRAAGAVAEEPWAFDRQWTPTAYTYKNDEGWLRMKLDAHVDESDWISVIDFKTGGIYPDHEDQAHLYAVGSFFRFREAEYVRVSFHYWDKNKIHHYEYSRTHDLPHMVQTWETRYEEMMSERRFLPQPGRHCRFCDFAKAKGGPCAYGK